MKFSSSLSKLVTLYLLLQAGLTLALILYSRNQNRHLIAAQAENLLQCSARGLQPIIERMLAEKAENHLADLEQLIRDFDSKTQIRVTVIDPSGIVQADSVADAEKMRNHERRPEIVQALSGNTGKATRLSETTHSEFYYLAIPLGSKPLYTGVLRLAKATAAIEKQVSDFSKEFIAFTLASVTLASIVILVIGRSSVSPLSELSQFAESITKGDYQRRLNPVRWLGEWRLLGNAFDQMQTELQGRESALRTNNDRLSAVLASMFEGIIAIDEQRRVLLANRATSSLLEIPYTSLLNRPFNELIRNPMIEECVEEVFRTHRTIGREFETKRTPRRILSVRISWIAQFDGQAVVIVVQDVTSLRQLETMRRDFVANVSHELKTPLTSIKAYSETLRLGAIDDPVHRLRFVERIEEQANRLSDLILDLIRLARIESGAEIFEIKDIHLGQIAQQRIQNFQEQAIKKNLSLRFEQTNSVIMVRCDDEGLATILDNLISNAVRYVPDGGNVLVRCSAEATKGIIEVIDNGLGIAPEHHERIFERFYRVDKARSSDLGGTGLGLSIVKHIVQSYSGHVSISSRLGKGSTFTVRLPLSSIHEQQGL